MYSIANKDREQNATRVINNIPSVKEAVGMALVNGYEMVIWGEQKIGDEIGIANGRRVASRRATWLKSKGYDK